MNLEKSLCFLNLFPVGKTDLLPRVVMSIKLHEVCIFLNLVIVLVQMTGTLDVKVSLISCVLGALN